MSHRHTDLTSRQLVHAADQGPKEPQDRFNLHQWTAVPLEGLLLGHGTCFFFQCTKLNKQYRFRIPMGVVGSITSSFRSTCSQQKKVLHHYSYTAVPSHTFPHLSIPSLHRSLIASTQLFARDTLRSSWTDRTRLYTFRALQGGDRVGVLYRLFFWRKQNPFFLSDVCAA